MKYSHAFSILVFMGVISSSPVQSRPHNIVEPATYCDLGNEKTQCQPGDLVTVVEKDVPFKCRVNRNIVRMDDKYLCEYLGTERNVRGESKKNIAKQSQSEYIFDNEEIQAASKDLLIKMLEFSHTISEEALKMNPEDIESVLDPLGLKEYKNKLDAKREVPKQE